MKKVLVLILLSISLIEFNSCSSTPPYFVDEEGSNENPSNPNEGNNNENEGNSTPFPEDLVALETVKALVNTSFGKDYDGALGFMNRIYFYDYVVYENKSQNATKYAIKAMLEKTTNSGAISIIKVTDTIKINVSTEGPEGLPPIKLSYIETQYHTHTMWYIKALNPNDVDKLLGGDSGYMFKGEWWMYKK